MMQAVAGRYSVKMVPTSAHHPQSNGKIERMHRGLGEYLRMHMKEEDNPSWENLLPAFMMAHNCAETERERYSPAFLLYGKDPRPVGKVMDADIEWKDRESSVEELLEALETARKNITEIRERVRMKLEERYNKGRVDVELKVGDKVFMYENTGGKIKGKLSKRWTGPWEVKAVKASGNAVDIEVKGEIRTMNVDSVMKETEEWDAEDMKRPPIGVREDGLENTHSIEDKKEKEKKKEGNEEEDQGQGMEMDLGQPAGDPDLKYLIPEPEKEDKREEKKNKKKTDYIEPELLKDLPRKKKIDENKLKINDFCLIQTVDTRYMVRIHDIEGDIYTGQFMLSHEREKKVEDRRYMRAWWDSLVDKIRIGGTKPKGKSSLLRSI